MKSIVITGVSSGIGLGTAKVLLSKGFHVFGSVRQQADAERIKTQLASDRFTPLIFDVLNESEVRQASEKVCDRLNGRTLFGLVNNAGIAVTGPLMHLSVEEYRHQIEVNLIAPLIVTQAFLPLLGGDRALLGQPGRIVNISSASGQIAGPFFGAYHASKFGLEGFSESLRRELMLYGIDVIVVAPGAVATPIWDKAEAIDLSVYGDTEYANSLKKYLTYMLRQGRKGFLPEYIGTVIWKALTHPKPKARYAVVPKPFVDWWMLRLLPKRVVDRAIAKKFGLTKL
jgi:NAD(P)-dependent dehydrogenase (short-subunit alcohol dehydrogenase family)